MSAVDLADAIIRGATVAIVHYSAEAASRELPWDGFGGLVRICDDENLREQGVVRAVSQQSNPVQRQTSIKSPPTEAITAAQLAADRDSGMRSGRKPIFMDGTRCAAGKRDRSACNPIAPIPRNLTQHITSSGHHSPTTPGSRTTFTRPWSIQRTSCAGGGTNATSSGSSSSLIRPKSGWRSREGAGQCGPTACSLLGAGDSLKSNISSSSGSGPSSAGAAPKGESGLCRICLEEDSLNNLEQPCACAGTQKYAHHECIQRWVNEKGNLRCEICDQQYRGNFSVPPQGAAGADDPGNMFSSMFAIRMDHAGEPLGGHHNRPALDFLDESDHYYQRNPLASWCFTFVIFVMFLVVLHHTMIVADGMDGTGPSQSSGDDTDDYATSLTLFLFWIGTKAFLIGIPLYTVMRIAARQARREQYEAMLRSTAFEAPARRYVWRMQLRDQERGHGHLPV
ncbi:hypothetical protein VOLCADRAFT_106491 [Volvox carteri f. nagariensis]|uniref:RING-CH-type domain-containing protein n=1 Tax=Volvox carteri f. nagariensis TaxID=3068 RepID=D8U7Q9_VOLCA|nr:uncharacterized protein VOLCADRAFT_106491 [Volvox carteri f. nagariensis]EFJ44345.1 hypothetical protein VOLCADRAFT_106491 [Volvox carteri f. nagariensis]|eukprot:XP_002954704.1 hypothetical protein VOLCADRAFT_106491 [Volvox carteri f. nagariensis]